MVKVITYGTFDVLHYGHINLLRRAKQLGDYLIVGLSTDDFNAQKGKKSFLNYNERKELLGAIKYVDEIIPETCWGQKESDIRDNKVDVFVMGDDWRGSFDDLPCKVVYLDRTANVSSTLIREGINK